MTLNDLINVASVLRQEYGGACRVGVRVKGDNDTPDSITLNVSLSAPPIIFEDHASNMHETLLLLVEK